MADKIDDFLLMDMLTDFCRLYINFTDSRLRNIRMRTGQSAIISLLGSCGQLSLKEISERRRISIPTTSVLVGRMERDGLVLRKPPKDGGKADDVILSPKGEHVCECLNDFMRADIRNILGGFTGEEKARLAEIYGKLLENLTGTMPFQK